MFSVFSTRALKTKMPVRTRRYLVVGVLLALSLVMVRAAYASQLYVYYFAFANPGVPHSSDGWNYREHNRVCRHDAVSGAYGIVRAADYNGAGTLVYDTGQVLTQCNIGIIASIEVYGYFLTRCWNSDGGGMTLYCQTTKP